MNELIEKILTLNIFDKRVVSEDYDEVVIFNNQIDHINSILQDYFGEPVKAAGAKPTKDDLRATSDFGGLWMDQTLYKKQQQDITEIAMLWPWQDNVHTTLKIARIKK